MKRKLLLFSLLLALMAPWAAVAQTTVEIGDGTGTTYYFPIDNYFNYSCTQQIYTAEEIGTSGNITAVSFYYNYGTAYTANNVTMYMKNVDRSNFSSTTDCEALALDDIVWTGSIAPTEAGWYTFELDTPFEYDGTSNLLVAFFDGTSGYPGTSYTWRQTTSPNSAYMALRYYSDSSCPDPYNLSSYSGSKQWYTYRSNIQIEITPAGGNYCAKPNHLQFTDVTSSSATVSWNSEVYNYNLEVKLASEGDDAWFRTGIGVNSWNLTGLTPLTTYDVRVQAVCDNDLESAWLVGSFTTPAVADEVGDYWSDDFESAAGLGWELINGSCTNQWNWGTAAHNGQGSQGIYISNDGGTSHAYTLNSGAMVYATKLLHFTEGKYEFTYDWIANGESTWDFLRVALVPATVTLTAGTSLPSGLSATAVPSNWIALDGGSKLNLVTTWQNKSVAVNVPAGTYYLVFAWRNDTSGGTTPPAAFDNVSISKMACAYDVTGLTANDTTTNSATLVWNPNGASQWQVAYSASASFADATVAMVEDTTYDMTGLQSSTIYYARVRAYCGGEDFGSWSTVFSFPTECAVLTTYPYTQNFDSYTTGNNVLPICWSYINTTSYSTYKAYPKVYNSNPHSGSNSLYFYSYAYYSSGTTTYDPQPQYAILPEMENLGGKLITLFARGYNVNSTFKIGTMSDPTDASTFTMITEQTGLTTTYQAEAFEYMIPDDCTDGYIAIMIDAASSSRTYNGVYIDDITVDFPPTCIKPRDLAVSDRRATSAKLTWTPRAEGQTQWQISFGDNHDLLLVDADNTYTLTGLVPDTTYTVKIRAYCSATDQSYWSDEVSFNTYPECTAPIELTASNITTSGVTLSWTELGTATEWVVAYKRSVDTDFTLTRTIRNNPTTTLRNLEEFTEYIAKVSQVRDGCDTVWSAALSFTTLENCITPTAFAADHVSGHNALLNWVGNNESYIVSYRTAAYFDGVNEQFNTSGVPTGWTRYSGLVDDVLSGSADLTTTTSGWLSNSYAFGAYNMKVNIYGSSCKYWLVTPEINLEDGYGLNFDLALTDFGNSNPIEDPTAQADDRFIVLIYADGVWNILQEWNNTGSENVYNNIATEGENVSIDLSNYAGQTVKIAFYGESTAAGGDNDMHIDNVIVGLPVDAGDWMTETVTDTAILLTGLMSETLYEAKLQGVCSNESLSHETSSIFFTTLDACPTPTQLAVDSVNVHFAILSWTENGEATSWQICVNGNEQNLIDVEENPYRLENLAQDTTYIVKVRANCGGNDGDSEWSNTVTLHTLVSCEIPTEFAATLTPGDGSVATLNWASDAESWVVAYKSATDSIFIQETVTDTTLMLTNLTPETTYIAMVKAICGGEDGESRWSSTVTFEPTNKITIGEGTATFNYLPFNNYYKYSLTQQIYTVAELGEAGIIESIDFYKPNTTVANRNLNIYMVSTNKNSFESTSDWISVTEEDLVFSGTVNFANNAWTTIQFDVDFIYDGTQNVAIIVDDNTGSYTSTTSFRSFTADATQAIYYYNDSNNYDPLGTPGTASSTTSSKNQIRILKSALSDCMKPMHLTATEVGPNSAVLDWIENGASESWWIEYWSVDSETYDGGVIDEVTEKPYTLTGLLPNTTYEVHVIPSCGVIEDDFDNMLLSDIISFTTLVSCPAPMNVEASDITHYAANVTWAGYNDSYKVFLGMDGEPTTLLSVDFTNGIPTDWVNNSTNPWVVVDGHIQSGNADIHNSTSSISVTMNYLANGSIEFDAECRGEGTSTYWDHCDFLIDNERLLYHGADVTNDGFVHYVFNVTSGEHTFTWSYTKDSSTHPTGDYFAVDNIVMNTTNIMWNNPVSTENAEYAFSELTAGNNYYVQVYGLCGETNSPMSEVISFTTVVDSLKVFVAEGEWGTATNWMDDEIPTIEQDAELRANVTIPSGCVAQANSIAQGNYTITIKDGGQLYSNFTTTATVEKNITGYGEGNGNWYLISIPRWSGTPTTSTVTGLLPAADSLFDLFAFDGTQSSTEWRNHKANPISSFVFGKGYLYANANDTTLQYTATMPRLFTGYLYVNGGSATSTLAYDTIAQMGSWNLVGNPLVHNGYIYLGVVGEDGNVILLPTAYYQMNETGTELVASDEAVAPYEGVFVQASGENQFAFVSSAPHGGRSGLDINVAQENEFVDRVLIRFGEGNSLQKFQLRDNSTRVFMTEGDKDYAVLFTDGNGETPVSFNAETDGTYTISYTTEGVNLSSLYLIDNETGTKVDLLANPSYTFETKAGEFANRFTIVYSVK